MYRDYLLSQIPGMRKAVAAAQQPAPAPNMVPAYGHNLNFQGTYNHARNTGVLNSTVAPAPHPAAQPSTVPPPVTNGRIPMPGLQPGAGQPQVSQDPVFQYLLTKNVAPATALLMTPKVKADPVFQNYIAQGAPVGPATDAAVFQSHITATYGPPPNPNAQIDIPGAVTNAAGDVAGGIINYPILTGVGPGGAGTGSISARDIAGDMSIPEAASAVDTFAGKGFGAVMQGVQKIPGADAVLGLYNKAANANMGYVGDDMHNVANGTGDFRFDPTYWFFHDLTPQDMQLLQLELKTGAISQADYDMVVKTGTGIKGWATNPDNKLAINAAYTVGLDLNGDGAIDVRGGQAVTLAYIAQAYPSFFGTLLAQTAFDPLFLATVGATAATGVARSGIASAAEGVEAGGRAATVLKALDAAMGVYEGVAHVGQRVADLPFTLTVGAARKAVGLIERVPKIGGRTAGFLADEAAPSANTTVRQSGQQAADFASEIINAPGTTPAGQQQPVIRAPLALPESLNPQEWVAGPGGQLVRAGQEANLTPDYSLTALPETTTTAADAVPTPEPRPILTRVPSESPGTIPLESGPIEPTVTTSTVNGLPKWKVGEDFRIRTVSGEGYVLEGRTTPGGRYVRAGVFTTPEDAIAEGKHLIGTRTMEAHPDTVVPTRPTDPDGNLVAVQRPIPTGTEGMTAEERTAAIRSQEIAPTDPVSGGTRLVDRAYDSQKDRPIASQDYATTYLPKKAAYDASQAAIEEQTRELKAQIQAIQTHIAVIQDAITARDWSVEGSRNATYLMKNSLYEQRDAAWNQLHPLIADQKLKGIEHVVNEQAPAFATSYHELPEVPTSAARHPVLDDNGNPVLKPDGSAVHKSYTEENVEYLYDRYVYTDNAQDAANVLRVLKGRTEITGRPHGQQVIDRLVTARKSLNDLKKSVDRGVTPARINADGQVVELPRPRSLLPDEITPQMRQQAETPPPSDFPNALPPQPLGMPTQIRKIRVTRPQVSVPHDAPPITLTDLVGERIVPDDARAFGNLSTPSRVYEKLVKGQWEATDRATAEKGIRRNKAGEFAGKMPEGDFEADGYRSRIEAVTPMQVLEQIMREMPEAPAGDIAQELAHRWMAITGSTLPPRTPLLPYITQSRLAKLGKGVSSSARSIAVHNPVTAPRALLGDYFSDTMRASVDGHPLSGVSGSDYLNKIVGKKTSAEQMADRFGKKLPDRIQGSHRGRTEIDTAGRSPTHKGLVDLINFATKGTHEEALAPGTRASNLIGKVTGGIDNRTVANARNGGDNVRREGIFESSVKMQEGAAKRGLQERGRMLAQTAGINTTEFDLVLDALGREFSTTDLQARMAALARDANLSIADANEFANSLTQDWANALNRIWKQADAEQGRVYFTYDRTKLDEQLGGVIFYHYWMSRAIPAYARIALRNPWIAAMWLRGWQDVKNRAERDGLPSSLRGYTRAMGSMDGWYGSITPWNVILPIADMMPDGTADTLYEQVTQFAAVTPLISTAASVIGLSNDVVDPFNTYAIRNMATAIVNKVRAENGIETPYTDPFANLLHRGYQLANDIVAKAPIPFAQQRQFLDPSTTATSEIRSVVAEHLATTLGVPVEQWSDPEWQQWQHIIANGEAGIDDPMYQDAYAEWADAKLKGRVFNSIIPGGVRERYGPRDQLMAGDLTDAQTQAKGFFNSGSAEDAQLDISMNEYQTLGTPRQRSLSDGYNAIMHPDMENDPNAPLVMPNGHFLRKQDVAALSEEDRRILAQQWVQGHDGTQELQDFWDTRDAWVAQHPEFGSYENTWLDSIRNYEGGVRAFRIDRAAANPNFKKAMEERRQYLLDHGTSPLMIDAELDNWARNLSGYKAAHGIQDYLYDPSPISTGDQATVDSLAKMGGIGGGNGSGGSSKKTTAQKLTGDIADYNRDADLLGGLLKNYGIDPSVATSHNPYAVDMMQRTFGDAMPHESTLMKQYHLWVQSQSPGTDTSPESFAAWFDQFTQDQAA